MNIKLFLIIMVIMCAMRQGPAVYRDLKCVESEPGYAKRLLYWFTGNEPEKICPTATDLTWRIGNEVFYSLLFVLLTLLLGYAPSAGKIVQEKWSAALSMFREWRARPSICRHCGSAPCLVKRSSLRKPSGTRTKDKANFAKRSNTMMLFYYGLELSVVMTKERPWNNLHLVRKSVQHFEEEQMVLFPVCIQRHINYWYSTLSLARCVLSLNRKSIVDHFNV